MSRPESRAGRSLAGDRVTAGAIDSPTIFAPAQPLGNCIGCGIRIDVRAGTLRCPTCAAWRRWYSAHRLASQALQEVRR